ncbi:MAG: hypothetical protein NXH83_01845 [Rhodobacteraceae bacterium]|nr:hypothetical protein [Paracoccaceae bacterium]
MGDWIQAILIGILILAGLLLLPFVWPIMMLALLIGGIWIIIKIFKDEDNTP